MWFLFFISIVVFVIILIYLLKDEKPKNKDNDVVQITITKPTIKTTVSYSEYEVIRKVKFHSYKLSQRPIETDTEYKLPSASQKDKLYTVNPFRLTCTCPDFVERRSNCPDNDLQRVCKHQNKLLRDIFLARKDLPDYEILKLVKTMNKIEFYELENLPQRTIIANGYDSSIVYIITKNKNGRYSNYPYYMDDSFWYDTKPKHHNEIETALSDIIEIKYIINSQ